MREIIASPAFDNAVEKLGGYRAIDLAMEPIIEALYRDPFGFSKFENDWTSFRYAKTKRIGIIPALVFIFSIQENGNVLLEHVEEDEPPY
jgi:hypothetical protein